MRCVVVLLVALGACGFHASPGVGGSPPPSPDATTPDPPTDALDLPTDTNLDGPAAPSFCDPNDPHIVVCYEFEGDAKDGSHNRLDATTDHVSFVAGKVGMAMKFADNSRADVDDTDAFNVQALTIEAWINPSELPHSGSAVILDVDRQYALSVLDDGSVNCKLVNAPHDPPATMEHVTVNRWTHVACTYDTNGAAVYVNGVSTPASPGGTTLGTAGDTGLSIAADNNPTALDRSRMIGLIDELRLMDVARTHQQICADAKRAPCP
jgi:hypothetical protein